MQNEDFKTIGSIVQVKDLLIEMIIILPRYRWDWKKMWDSRVETF